MERVSSSGLSCVLQGGAETIVAAASAPGRSALAIVRLSGPGVADISEAVCRDVDVGRPWRAQLVEVQSGGGEALGRAMATVYRAPRSYTGEDMLELVVHGSPYLVGRVVKGCMAAGARPAEAGEFTRRAVANGKMDLVQAEGVRDLIAAETAWQLRCARAQVAGALSGRFAELRAALVKYLCALEVVVEFVDEGMGVSSEVLDGMREDCLAVVEGLLATAGAGRRLREGLRIVIAGAPNSGKSTLFNRLLDEERAIVSARPGTTRDVLEAELEIEGLAACLVDTAGFRESGDEVEIEGVRRAGAAVAGADVVVLLEAADGSAETCGWVAAEGAETVWVRSKCDLAGSPGRGGGEGGMRVSAVTGEGLGELRERLAEIVRGSVADLEGGVAVGERHRTALVRAACELRESDPEEPELAAENVRVALDAVRLLTGEVANEEVLDEVFRQFCIGK